MTDAQWAKMEPHCLGKPSDPGGSGSDNRLFIEAVLWIVRTGSPWRDLPEVFGKWNTVFKRYRDWVKADVFARLFEACSDEPDMELGFNGPSQHVHAWIVAARQALRRAFANRAFCEVYR